MESCSTVQTLNFLLKIFDKHYFPLIYSSLIIFIPMKLRIAETIKLIFFLWQWKFNAIITRS